MPSSRDRGPARIAPDTAFFQPWTIPPFEYESRKMRQVAQRPPRHGGRRGAIESLRLQLPALHLPQVEGAREELGAAFSSHR